MTADRSCEPCRSPDSGSAWMGAPSTRARSASAGGNEASRCAPATRSTSRPESCSARSESSDPGGWMGPRTVRAGDPASGATPMSAADVRGSRNGKLRWTGPAGTSLAIVHACAARLGAVVADASSGTPASWNHLTAVPYSSIWSIVCGAPTPRNSGGRSALKTSSGTREALASTTAGWKWVAAEPDVQETATGSARRRASPSAKKAADRSS